MEKYYILAIKKGSINAMINYWRSNNNFDEMKKYYLMTEEDSLYNFGLYYYNQNDINNMINYIKNL
jgi:TPR repeat protein